MIHRIWGLIILWPTLSAMFYLLTYGILGVDPPFEKDWDIKIVSAFMIIGGAMIMIGFFGLGMWLVVK